MSKYQNSSFNTYYIENINKLNTAHFDENIVSETSTPKNQWNFTSSIFNKEYKTKLNQRELYSKHWNVSHTNKSTSNTDSISTQVIEQMNFHSKNFLQENIKFFMKKILWNNYHQNIGE